MKTARLIDVHPLTNDPTGLWDLLKTHQRQVLLKMNLFTDASKPKPADHVRIVCISDTHNRTKDLDPPPGDILIHAGDFTNVGKPSEIDSFNEFLGRVKDKYSHIVVIAGNHDLTFDSKDCDAKRYLNTQHQNVCEKDMESKLSNCVYLKDDFINLMGLKIYGSPWQPEFGGWAFNLKRGEECLEKWQRIPADTDVLVTHGPPLGYGDLCSSGLRAGCSELLATIQQRVKPKLHVFGHIHEGYGVWSDGTTTFVNASTCNLSYRPLNAPIIVDLLSPLGKAAR